MTRPARDSTERTPRPEPDVQWSVTNLDGNLTNAKIRGKALQKLWLDRAHTGNRVTQHLKDHDRAQRRAKKSVDRNPPTGL